jgi:hypothetical protein
VAEPLNAVQLSERGRPIVVLLPGGHCRIAVELFEVADRHGLAFADIGWADPLQPGHPFHVLEGRLVGEDGGPWAVGAIPLRRPLLKLLRRDDPLWASWRDWQRWRKSEDGRGATRKLARQQISQQLRLELRG